MSGGGLRSFAGTMFCRSLTRTCAHRPDKTNGHMSMLGWVKGFGRHQVRIRKREHSWNKTEVDEARKWREFCRRLSWFTTQNPKKGRSIFDSIIWQKFFRPKYKYTKIPKPNLNHLLVGLLILRRTVLSTLNSFLFNTLMRLIVRFIHFWSHFFFRWKSIVQKCSTESKFADLFFLFLTP